MRLQQGVRMYETYENEGMPREDFGKDRLTEGILREGSLGEEVNAR